MAVGRTGRGSSWSGSRTTGSTINFLSLFLSFFPGPVSQFIAPHIRCGHAAADAAESIGVGASPRSRSVCVAASPPMAEPRTREAHLQAKGSANRYGTAVEGTALHSTVSSSLASTASARRSAAARSRVLNCEIFQEIFFKISIKN